MNNAFVASTMTACPENLIDSARVQVYLGKNGWRIVKDPAVADLIILNTCGLVNYSVNCSVDAVERLQRVSKKGAKFIAWGCLAKIDPEVLKQVYDGPIFGEDEIFKLDEIIKATTPINDVVANELGSRYQNQIKKNGTRKDAYGIGVSLIKWYYSYFERKLNLCRPSASSIFYIKTSTGCLNNCAYCVVRNSSGRIRSKSVDEIMVEFKNGLDKGYKEFSLLATDLGPHGRDLNYTLADLLREMVKVEGEYRIGLRNVNPHYLERMLNDMEPVLSSGKVWFIGIPLESGSNRILKSMRRNHTAEGFRKSLAFIKRTNPDITIRTQLMVGFPTETEGDFSETMQLFDEADLDFAEVYRFSSRPGTTAYEMDEQVPESVARRRLEKLVVKVLVSTTRRELGRRFSLSVPRRQTKQN
ncbi:MiaB/RimO family radical SAM methylthiotransferase [Chloroflexota bacterium]